MRLNTSAYMLGVVFLSLVALSVSAPVLAEVALNPNHPDTYTVRRGDTLWDIAGRFLREPWRWSEIWDANPAINNPNLIYPGDVLQLYYRNGQPRIGLAGGMRTVKLSPRVRSTPIQVPIPTIPIGAIQPFLTRAYVLDKEQIDDAPYVVSFPDRRVVGGVGDRFYVRSILDGTERHYHVVRPGGPYRSSDTGKILGYKAEYVADAVLERSGDPATLKVDSMTLDVEIGDRVLPASADQSLSSFYPHPGPAGLKGRIISVLNGVSEIGRYNVVVLDIGKDQGVEPGQVFNIYNGGELVKDRVAAEASNWDWKNMKFWSQQFWYGDYRVDRWIEGEPDENAPLPLHVGAEPQTTDYVLPYEQAGRLMVFRAFSRVSFALVMSATRAMHVLDTVRPPKS